MTIEDPALLPEIARKLSLAGRRIASATFRHGEIDLNLQADHAFSDAIAKSLTQPPSPARRHSLVASPPLAKS